MTTDKAISEGKIFFYDAGGHDHDGLNSSIIDTDAYSVFDFPLGFTYGRNTVQRTNRQVSNSDAWERWIISVVNNNVISPQAIELNADSFINGDRIVSKSINATHIEANSITADLISTDAIKSSNYAHTPGNTYSTSGSFFDLALGEILTPNFSILNGNASFRGTINASSFNDGIFTGNIDCQGTIDGGVISGSTIVADTVYVKKRAGTNFYELTIDSLGTIKQYGVNSYEYFTITESKLEWYNGNLFSDFEISSNGTYTTMSGTQGLLLYPNDLVLDAVFGPIQVVKQIHANQYVRTDTYFEAPQGSDPSYRFVSDGDTGLSHMGTNQVGLTAGGATPLFITQTEMYINTSLRGMRFWHGTSSGGTGWTNSIGFYWTGSSLYSCVDHNGHFYLGGSSDRRVKANFEWIDNAIDIVNSLNPVTFNYRTYWKNDDGHLEFGDVDPEQGRSYGLIADEVEQVLPELVIGQGKDSPEELQSVSYQLFAPILIKAVQEQNVIINEQADVIKSLERRLEAVEALVGI